MPRLKKPTKTPAPPLLRPNSVETFIKHYTSLRLKVESRDRLIEVLERVARQVLKEAESIARQEDTNTLLPRHLDQGFQAIGGVPGEPISPDALFGYLDLLPPLDLANLVRIIDEWLKQRVDDITEHLVQHGQGQGRDHYLFPAPTFRIASSSDPLETGFARTRFAPGTFTLSSPVTMMTL